MKKVLIESDTNSNYIPNLSPKTITNKKLNEELEKKQNQVKNFMNNITINQIKNDESIITRSDVKNKLIKIDGFDFFPYESDSNYQIESKISLVFHPNDDGRIKSEKLKIYNTNTDNQNKNFKITKESEKEENELKLSKIKLKTMNSYEAKPTNINPGLNENFDIYIEETDNPNEFRNPSKNLPIKRVNIEIHPKVGDIRRNNFDALSSCEEGELRKLEKNIEEQSKKNPKKLKNISYIPSESEIESTNKNIMQDNNSNFKNNYFNNIEVNKFNPLYNSHFTNPYYHHHVYNGYHTPQSIQSFPIRYLNSANNYYMSTNFSSEHPGLSHNNQISQFHINNLDSLTNVNSHYINSCYYCEEIYKYVIINNLPLKIMTCLYCNNTINEKALEFFIEKFRKELIDIYRNKHEYNTECISYIDHIEIKSDEEENEENPKGNYTLKEGLQNEITFKNKKCKIEKEEEFIRKSKKRFKSCDINLSNEKERDNTKSYIREESENIQLDSTNITGPSLAEMFRKRKADLISKMVNRSKNNQTQNESEILEMKNIEKIKQQKKYRCLNVTNLANVEQKQKINPKKEPSKELLERLIYGKKVKVKLIF